MNKTMKSIILFLLSMVIIVSPAFAENKYRIQKLDDGTVCVTYADVDDKTTILEVPSKLNNCDVTQIDTGAIGWGKKSRTC